MEDPTKYFVQINSKKISCTVKKQVTITNFAVQISGIRACKLKNAKTKLVDALYMTKCFVIDGQSEGQTDF